MATIWCLSLMVFIQHPSGAMNFEGSLNSHSPWLLWSEDNDTVDHLPLLLMLFLLLPHYNISFSCISNIYSSSTLPLNLGAPKLIVHYRHIYSPNVIAFRAFHNPATSLFYLFYYCPTLYKLRRSAKRNTCQHMRKTNLPTTFEKNMMNVLKRELF